MFRARYLYSAEVKTVIANIGCEVNNEAVFR